jgi:hypothetical protein
MKHRWFTLLAFACFWIPIACYSFNNEPDGFRGIKWGTNLSSNASEMTLVEKGEENYYFRKKDKLAIGGAELKRIAYGYWHGVLSSVFIETDGVSNKRALIDAFKAQFGTPDKPNQFLDEYWWNGAVTIISIHCQAIGDRCNAVLFSTKHMNQRQEERKKAASGAKKDF